ncbi:MULTISPECIES: hypothetical protein [unclassified Moorena]|uniref:hypothetical protein n=1 Tax=unclassified Moorena TaxID=2683338 RepID=UPI001400CAA0|nr:MULTISPECIES: hypothetical protein [unclassified Moorena]NEO17656.1 hypothetical protein [Moorena sp. SIO3E8]NEP97891.1 hypothetical protein [Moorena sp. SIO3F7]
MRCSQRAATRTLFFEGTKECHAQQRAATRTRLVKFEYEGAMLSKEPLRERFSYLWN